MIVLENKEKEPMNHQDHENHIDHDHMNHEHNHPGGGHNHMNHNKAGLRELIELIIGWVLVIPLIITMIPNTPALDPIRNIWVQFSIATVIQFYFGRKFYLGLYHELVKQKWPGMYTLIAFATTVAYVFSIYLISVNRVDHLYFEVSASIIMIVLLGDYIAAVVQTKATSGLESLMSLQVKDVLVLDSKTKQENLTKIENVKLNDILIVRKGEAIPTDGILISNQALLNESLLTGESRLIDKTIGESLIGGTINVGDTFQMQATKLGKDTVLANIIKSVEETQAQKPKMQKIADKVSGWFTPIVILIALLVFLIRYFALKDNASSSVETAIATLIIACPCALGIATPLAVAVGINKAAKLGIIYNQADAFEKITKIDAIAFDKTGTLTTGELTLTKVYGNQENIKLAISLEKYSTHPIAKAFNNFQRENKIATLFQITNVKEDIGHGINAKWEKKTIIMSSLSKLLEAKFKLDKELKKLDLSTIGKNKTIIALAINKVIVSLFILEDQIQKDAFKVIKKLQSKNITVVLISGDQEEITAEVAKSLKIKRYFANVKPVEKAEIVKQLQQEGKRVAFVGDGVNDSVALQQADLAIAMGKGSDIAKKNGDITIANNSIVAIYQAIILTKKTKKNIWLNFGWAFAYNVVVIPLAAAGFIIPPLAAVAMAFSNIAVVTNSLVFKLRKYKYN